MTSCDLRKTKFFCVGSTTISRLLDGTAGMTPLFYLEQLLIDLRRVKNFSRDVSDGENYTILLNQLKPDQCSRAPLQTRDLRQRAEQVI